MFGGGDQALTWLGSDPAEYESAYELKTDNADDPWSPLIAACDVLNHRPLEQLAEAADSVLAVDRWLWFLAIENLFTDEDSYLTKGWDYQLYYEVETGRIHPLEHDGNESFIARDANLSPFAGENNANRPVISRLLAVPSLRQRYLAHLRTILDESFDWKVLGPKIAAYRALIEEEVKADPKKLYSYDRFLSGLSELENFVEARRRYLLAYPEVARQAPAILAVARTPLKTLPASKASQLASIPSALRVTAEVGNAAAISQMSLYYGTGLSGPFASVPMFDDGGHEDGAANDGLFAGEIPSFPVGTLVRYYLEARATDGTTTFSPAGAEHDVFVYQVAPRLATLTPVVINELMAANDGYLQDPQGDFDDWIELYNLAPQEVDLSGMYLTDDAANLRKWAFPQGTILAPGAYLVVWADEDGGDEPGLHANFKLAASGEAVYLVDADAQGNAILDSVVFGPQEADLSYGRLPDGTGPFQVITSPTPSAANLTLTPTAVADETSGMLPMHFSLEQNFPNPFNSSTLIRFALPAGTADPQGCAELGIFNLAGQPVVSLDLREYPPGFYEWRWDGRDQQGQALASGVYLCRLRVGRQTETRRMALLR